MARTSIAVILLAAFLAGAFESRAESGAEPISESEEQHDMKALTEFATRYAAAWSSQDPVAFAAFYAETRSISGDTNNGSWTRTA